MPSIDLRPYVVARWGDWSSRQGSFTPTLLRLDGPDDGLTLTGPLRVKVSVQARNELHLLGTGRLAVQAREAFCYVLDIPPGQTWTYPAPQFRRPMISLADGPRRIYSVAGSGLMSASYADTITETSVGSPSPFLGYAETTIGTGGGSGGGTSGSNRNVETATSPGLVSDTTRDSGPQNTPPANQPAANQPPANQLPEERPTVRLPNVPNVMLGTNGGFSILIRPAGHESCGDPCADLVPDPCAPARGDCGCGCGGARADSDCGCGGKCGGGGTCGCGGDDIPCDYAVVSRPGAGRFFPSACEPCAPGATIAIPAPRGPSLVVPPAPGGPVRTRFFTGMFITKEDLETEQRNVRLKRTLMNRAMGQGVVWGLGVGLDGDAICVRPGYGVDCCGNDLVLGATYRVDADALLRDPAARSIRCGEGSQCAHLVLEYFECPEQPRPVHGDVCAPEATRCETSRVRETVRLRLAPPCDVDRSGPIADFLQEIEALRGDPKVSALFEAAPAPAGTTTQQASTVPFDVQVRVDFTNQDLEAAPVAVSGTIVLDPPVQPPPAEGVTGYGRADGGTTQVTVTLQAKPSFRFTGGTVEQRRDVDTTVGPTASVPVSRTIGAQRTDTQVRWAFKLPRRGYLNVGNAGQADPVPPGIEFVFNNWTMSEAGGGEWKGTTFIELAPLIDRQWSQMPAHQRVAPTANEVNPGEGDFVLYAMIPPGKPSVVSAAPKTPCMTECCDDGPSRFGISPIWMHENPMKPGQPADAKVIMLAIWYGWMKAMVARNAAAGNAAGNAQNQLAALIYRAAWRGAFGIDPLAVRADLSGALQRLLEAWCRGFLYPGPRCRCEPHGVVIGSVCIEGGAIQSVDAWGGRRWVMHYPLLAHWGQQLGVMPIDAVASKLFGLVCCVAGLPVPAFDDRRGGYANARRVRMEERAWMQPGERAVDLGNAMLVHGDETVLASHLADAGLRTARRETLDPAEFLARVSDAVMRPPEGALADHPLVDYTVTGAPDVHFVAPAPPEAGPARERPASTAPNAGTTAGDDLHEIVRGEIAARRARSTVPALLRGFTQSLAMGIAAAMPLMPASEPEQPVVDRLGGAGVHTVADALRRNAETLHDEVLHRDNAPELAAILERSEGAARTAARVAGDAVLAAATRQGIAARGGFASPEMRERLASDIEERLLAAKLPAPPEDRVRAAVDRALGEG